MQRIAKVQMSLEFLSEMISGRAGVEGGYRIETTAPDDLEVVGFVPDDTLPWRAWVYCKSDSFEPASLENIPEVEPFQYTLVKI